MIKPAHRRIGKAGGIIIFGILFAGMAAGQTAAPPAQAPAPAAPALKVKQASSQYGEIYLVYERLSRDGDRIIADGNVELHYKNIILYADHLEADSRTKDVLAVGKVTLHIGEEPKKPKAAKPETPATEAQIQ